MYSVRLAPAPSEYDSVIADLWEAGTVGIVEGHGLLEAFFTDVETARRFGDPMTAPDTDWVRETQDAWPPILVGDRFFLAAPWRTEPTPAGRIRLEINPGMQCGTGQHPCTRLCLEAMEREILPGDSVLDVGSGSGILSIAAKLLGAGRVIACDIDPDAARPVPFFVGSVDAVRTGAFDVVVANISEDVLGPLRPDLERVARRRILSGFQDEKGEWTCVIS
ncbi:MAG TPA: 50S ribosomal protein L11 methyltransferase [Bryobacteraceae bacterium]|jgi:ribosomal protein L11 methyltransferase